LLPVSECWTSNQRLFCWWRSGFCLLKVC